MKLYKFMYHNTEGNMGYKLHEFNVTNEEESHYEMDSATGKTITQKANVWQPGSNNPYNRHQFFQGEENIEQCRTMFLQGIQQEQREQIEGIQKDLQALQQGEEYLYIRLGYLSNQNNGYGLLTATLSGHELKTYFEKIEDFHVEGDVLHHASLIEENSEYPEYYRRAFSLKEANEWREVNSVTVAKDLFVDGSTLAVNALVSEYMHNAYKELTEKLEKALEQYFQVVDIEEVK